MRYIFARSLKTRKAGNPTRRKYQGKFGPFDDDRNCQFCSGDLAVYLFGLSRKYSSADIRDGRATDRDGRLAHSDIYSGS